VIVRFEELLEAGPDLLGRLADFLEHRDEHAAEVAHLRQVRDELVEIIGQLEEEVAPWRKLRAWLPRRGRAA